MQRASLFLRVYDQMKAYFYRVVQSRRSRSGAPAALGPAGQPWQQVPKINLLLKSRSGVTSAQLIRGLLVVVILVEAILFLMSFQSLVSANGDQDSLREDLQAVQLSLDTELDIVSDLREEISQLREERDAAALPFQTVAAGRRELDAALSTLFGAQVSGVEIGSLNTQPGGILELNGRAPDTQSVARFQDRLRSEDTILEPVTLQLNLVESSNPTQNGGGPTSFVEFTASVKLKQKASGP